jgi:hypothetical protein
MPHGGVASAKTRSMVAGACPVLIRLISPLHLETLSADGLTKVRLDTVLPCWPRRGQCRGAIAGVRECANACSCVSSLPRLWRRPSETHVGGVRRCEPLIFIIFLDLSPARQACHRDRRYTGVCQRTLSCVSSLRRQWRVSPETPLSGLGFADANP